MKSPRFSPAAWSGTASPGCSADPLRRVSTRAARGEAPDDDRHSATASPLVVRLRQNPPQDGLDQWRTATLKPPAFEYHRPEVLEEALGIMAEHSDRAKPLAGGQSLVPLLAVRRVRPAHIVDLHRIAELRQISVADGRVRIGAMARQRDLEQDPRMPGLVRAAVPHIGHFQIRNRGTVGGSLCHMDPAAEWPAVALALDAVMVAASVRGRREITVGDFMVGPQSTGLEPDELLVEVIVPVGDEGFGFAEVTRRGVGDFALVGAACQANAVAVFGAGPRAQRLTAVEELLNSGGGAGAEVAALAATEIQAIDDLHTSAQYRREVAARLVGAVVEQSRTPGGPA
jgi:aerobic carbon-monoxide dehydrogenase medium subunit